MLGECVLLPLLLLRQNGISFVQWASVDGDRFEGTFANDKREGKGVFFYRDKGSIYEGLWHDDEAICGTYKKLPEKIQNYLPLLETVNSDRLADDIINESIASIEVDRCNKLP